LSRLTHSTLEGEAAEQSRLSVEVETVENGRDIPKILSRLEVSTRRIRAYFLISFTLLGVWLGVKLTAKGGTWPGEIAGAMALLLVFAGAFIAHRAVRLERSGEEQKLALEEMREIAKSDPLALEPSLRQVKRLSRRFSATHGENDRIAREVVSLIEEARAEARELPIAHHVAVEDADDLPRPV
jgi:hypothetical protein